MRAASLRIAGIFLEWRVALSGLIGGSNSSMESLSRCFASMSHAAPLPGSCAVQLTAYRLILFLQRLAHRLTEVSRHVRSTFGPLVDRGSRCCRCRLADADDRLTVVMCCLVCEQDPRHTRLRHGTSAQLFPRTSSTVLDGLQASSGRQGKHRRSGATGTLLQQCQSVRTRRQCAGDATAPPRASPSAAGCRER